MHLTIGLSVRYRTEAVRLLFARKVSFKLVLSVAVDRGEGGCFFAS
jgi:hypothetical protein